MAWPQILDDEQQSIGAIADHAALDFFSWYRGIFPTHTAQGAPLTRQSHPWASFSSPPNPGQPVSEACLCREAASGPEASKCLHASDSAASRLSCPGAPFQFRYFSSITTRTMSNVTDFNLTWVTEDGISPVPPYSRQVGRTFATDYSSNSELQVVTYMRKILRKGPHTRIQVVVGTTS